MAKILILHPFTESEYGRQSIPIAIISTLLSNQNHKCELFDTTFMHNSEILGQRVRHEDQLVKHKYFKGWEDSNLNFAKTEGNVFKNLQNHIDKFKPDLITFSFWGSHLHAEGEYFSYKNGLKLIENVNTHNIPIVVGGTIPSANPQKILSNNKINFIVKGESELVYQDIASKIDKKEEFKSVKNIHYLDENKNYHFNEMRPLIDPLDQLPDVSFDIYNKKTFKRPYHGKILNMVDYELSRGCWYRCTFCLSPFQREATYKKPKNFRREKSISKIIREISNLKKKYNLDMIRYQDESFNSISEDKLKDLAKDYKKYVDLPFIIEATVNTTTENKINYLKEMGCAGIGLGIESGSKKIRDEVIIKPKFENKEAVEKIKLLKKSGISVTVYNIFGFPYETEKDLLKTIELNYLSKPNYATVSYFQPWEGTKLKEIALEKGFLDKDLEVEQMTEGGQQGSSTLKLSEIKKNSLEHFHDYFTYYVYLNKLFHPLIKFAAQKNLFSKYIKKILTRILEKNLRKNRQVKI